MAGAWRGIGRTAAVAAGVAAVAYPALLRRWCLTWGATPDEARRALPGDDLLPLPDVLTTRAVTIAAPPAAIWPWLVQMGSGRGGAYTYDWIENLLGLDMHSADHVLPQFQDLRLGDVLPVGPDGPGLRVAVLEPGRTLTFQSEDGRWVWIFALFPGQHGRTRLISRNRIWTPELSMVGRLANAAVMEPGSLVMERKMLLGIRSRAERLAGASTPDHGGSASPAAPPAEPPAPAVQPSRATIAPPAQ